MGNLAVWQALVLLVVAFYFLARSSSCLVDGAVGIAERLRLPKLLVGIVLVGFATTAPEFAVSIIAALSGNPEMALGNAVGSVIVDDGVALALVGLLAATPVVVPRRMLLQTAAFLVVIDVVAFILVITNRVESDFVLTRWGGGVLLGLFFVYLVYIIWDRVRRPDEHPAVDAEPPGSETQEAETKPLGKLVGLFVVGLAVVIGASHVVVECAVVIATAARIPEAVVALTIVAIGTSLPEIATCITATRKGHGALAVGDIIGADVLNIAWIAGASALVNPLVVEQRVIYFMFPAMLVIVFTTLGGLIICRRMTRGLGIVLLAQYAVYLAVMLAMFVFNIELW